MITVKDFSKEQWLPLAEDAHVVTFGEIRSSLLEKFDFVLMAEEDGVPGGWVTCHEMDSDTVYWQYGGALPKHAGTIHIYRGYYKMILWCQERYKRITTRIAADNQSMLRMALKVGFRIIGTTLHGGDVFVELVNDKERN